MREENNKKKRIVNTVVSCCLIAALIITGIYALLQASDTRTNTYSYGNVDAVLYEDDWYDHNTNALIGDEDGNGVKDIAEHVACYEKVDKTPYIVNTGINDAYAFIAVGIPTIDYTYVYGTESEVKASYGMSVGIKVNAYVVQDRLVDDVADEDKLQTMWNYCINGDTVKNIPVSRRSNKGLESVSVCDINEDWELVDVIKSTKEVVKDRDGNIVLGANGEQLEFAYNYYVYGYKKLLLGEESYKDKYGTKPNLEVEPDTEETDIALQYWNSYNKDICTTPIFTKFEINNLGTKKWACIKGLGYEQWSRHAIRETPCFQYTDAYKYTTPFDFGENVATQFEIYQTAVNKIKLIEAKEILQYQEDATLSFDINSILTSLTVSGITEEVKTASGLTTAELNSLNISVDGKLMIKEEEVPYIRDLTRNTSEIPDVSGVRVKYCSEIITTDAMKLSDHSKLYFVFTPVHVVTYSKRWMTNVYIINSSNFFGNIVQAVIELEDGSKFYNNTTPQTKLYDRCGPLSYYYIMLATQGYSCAEGISAKNTVIENIGGHLDYNYKISDVYFGTVGEDGIAPHISLVCYEGNDMLMKGVTLAFDIYEHNGIKYDLTPTKNNTSQVKFKGFEVTPVFEGTFQDWFEACINTGEFVGDCPWLR